MKTESEIHQALAACEYMRQLALMQGIDAPFYFDWQVAMLWVLEQPGRPMLTIDDAIEYSSQRGNFQEPKLLALVRDSMAAHDSYHEVQRGMHDGT